jgi:peptide/nickel transport system permease protein
MLRYVLRRTLYMIPTVLGIVIVTFVLFNVVGGDPAMVKLGKNTSPKALEDFDAQRGYNKPLLFGQWGRIRAYTDPEFSRTLGPWKPVQGVFATNAPVPHLVLPAGGGPYAAPLAFGLPAGGTYRWDIRYRLPAGRARFTVRDAAGTLRSAQLPASASWKRAALIFSARGAADLRCEFETEGGDLGVSSLRLRRRMAHVFDSQLLFTLRQLARLEFGTSHETNERVGQMIRRGILPSLALTVPMFFIELALSISLALVCAFFRDSAIDRFFVVLGVVLMSVNYLVWIVLGQFVLGYLARLFPIWGFESWRYIALPCLIGVASGLGANIRFYRTVMLDEMYRDYVRTAFAKGVGRAGVLFRHVLKNAMIPILTSVVMAIPFLYTGSLLLETFFGIPGLGRMGINGINGADFDVIKALVFVGAMIYVVANLVTDICYALVDPRVRLR